MEKDRITIRDILSMKGKRKITGLTAYGYPFARLVDRAGIDIVLVGDSLANVVLGLESTTQVGMQEMLTHTKAVRRAVKRALLVGDMPYEAYQLSSADPLRNARQFIEEAGCDAIKLEWFEHCLETTQVILNSGIAVMGHIGLTPQTADKLGGFKVQGKDAEVAKRLIWQAGKLEKIGCFSIVLECIPAKIAQIITQRLKIPTIGIGAGPFCDGQILVINDILGLCEGFQPRFVKQYVDLADAARKAIEEYKNDVLNGQFPAKEHSFLIKEEELKKIGLE